jgi:hypothetical protein
MHREEDDMVVLFNSKGLGLKDKKSSPSIKGRDGLWARISRITAQY